MSLDLSTVVMDSLPYAETVHEDYEEYALSLIEEEMKAIEPRRLRKIPPLNFRTPTMQTEYNTLVVSTPVEGDPESTKLAFRQRPKENSLAYQSSKIVAPTTLEEWDTEAGRKALSQLKSRFESERIRSVILEAEKQEGVAIWKDYNAHLDQVAASWTEGVKEQVDAVEEINFQRQQAQTQRMGPEIDRLTQEYEKALYRRNQLVYAIEAINRERRNGTIDSKKGKVED